MKKVLAMVLTICMVMAFVPQISFAADTTITAATTAFFTSSSALSTVEGSTESGSSCVLVAWNHADNWNAASSFTDTDGTVTSQTVTGGTGFGSSRHAVVSFNIPSDFDADETAKVTLGLKVRYVKQINQAGTRLAIYGNSVDGTWTTSSNKSIFGVNGTDSGLANLPLLGLTSPINSAGDVQVDQEVTLSSLALTEYVKQMANEGKTQVTFRIAVPYGGVWIYNSTSSYPATLKIEEGAVTTVNVKTVYLDEDGSELSNLTEEKTVNSVIAGSTYTYSENVAPAVSLEEGVFVFSEEDSTLSTVANADGTSEVVIVYKKDDGSLTFSGFEVDDEGAWCWFADPRSISYANDEGTLDFSIIGYIDVHGDIKATQINYLTNEVNEVLIRSNIQPDDHNNPTFLVLPDERIVVFYSRHTDENCFWYRVTEKKGDLTTLGEEKCLNTNHSTTYPSPFIMEDDPDHIYLMWRGVNWHPTCARLTIPDEEGNMEFDVQPFQVVNSTAQSSGCRPYAKYASDGKGKIYMTYTSTHPDNIYPVCIYYSCLDVTDFTLYDINGGVLKANVNTTGAFTVNGRETDSRFVVDSTSTSQRGWVWQIAISEDGKPVIAMVRINQAKSNHDYYYAKWNGTEWVKTFLANGGTSFHQSTSSGLELCYSGGMAIDPNNTNVMYCSVPVEGAYGKVYEIVKYTMNDDGTNVVSTEQITRNSEKNNVRPFVIPNSEGKDIRLVWMHGDYYDWIVSNAYTTQGFCTSVMANAALPTEDVDLSDAVVEEDYSSIGGAFVATKEIANIVEAEVDGEFTVSADIYLGGDYEGKLLDLGGVEVSVETMSTQYGATQTGDRARVQVTIDGEDYVTSNVYGSSDCWVNFNRGTGGNYGVENYQGYVNHTVTYDGEYLTLYRNGLLDLKISASELSVENVRIGNFDGMVSEVAVYDRVLNHDEIKVLAEVDDEIEAPDVEGDIKVKKTYSDVFGNVLSSFEETLNAGTETFNFVPVERIRTEDSIYELLTMQEENGEYVAIYNKIHTIGENLIYNGDMSETTTDGTYTYVTGWQGGYTNRIHNDLSDRPYLYESGAWMATADAHFIYTPATEDEKAYVTTPATSAMGSGAEYPWKSDANEPYMGAVLTSWMKDASDVNQYLKAEAGRTYIMSFEMKASEIASWQNNVIGFDAVTQNGDAYANKLPGTNGDIGTMTSVLDTHIGRARYLDTADEWVTIETTATALNDGYFVFQLGWAHEWGQVSVRNFKVRELCEPVTIRVTTALEGSTLTVTAEDVGEGCVIAVSVNDSEKIMTKAYDGQTSYTFDVGADAEKVVVYIWNSITSMQPLLDKIIVK